MIDDWWSMIDEWCLVRVPTRFNWFKNFLFFCAPDEPSFNRKLWELLADLQLIDAERDTEYPLVVDVFWMLYLFGLAPAWTLCQFRFMMPFGSYASMPLGLGVFRTQVSQFVNFREFFKIDAWKFFKQFSSHEISIQKHSSHLKFWNIIIDHCIWNFEIDFKFLFKVFFYKNSQYRLWR